MFEIASAISGVSAALDVLRKALDARDDTNIKKAVSDMADRLTAAQTRSFELLEQLTALQVERNDLRDRVIQLEGERAQRDRYRITKLGTVGSFFAYELKVVEGAPDGAGEPHHYICQRCFDTNGHKSVLNVGPHTAACLLCKTTVLINERPTPPVRRRAGGWINRY